VNRYFLLLFLVFIAVIPTSLDAQDRETIAIIGTGDLGNSVGPKWAEAGHRVIYGSRDPTRDSVRSLVARSGPDASAMTQKGAAQEAQIIVLAVPGTAVEHVARNLGDLEGKIVIDATFAARQAEDGYMESVFETSGAEMIQAWNPGARLVKTDFNSSYVIDDPTITGNLETSFVASDDREAKEIAAKLIAELGLRPLDAGPLRHAREIEAMVRLFYVPLLQGRQEEFRFTVHPSTFWTCLYDWDWYKPVYDAENLAELPEPETPPEPCSSHPPLN